jgi:hypothetical protein
VTIGSSCDKESLTGILLLLKISMKKYEEIAIKIGNKVGIH